MNVKCLTSLAGCCLLVSLFFSSCNDDEKTPSVDANLLTGGTTKTWKLTEQRVLGELECLGTCELAYNKMRFNANKTGEFSTFTCLQEPCSNGTTAQDGGTFNWTVSGKQLTVDGFPAEILSLTATTFKWKLDIFGFAVEETYTATTDDPFLTRSQMMAGSSSKTWKYAKRSINGFDTPLTSCLINARITNFTNGTYTITYTEEGCPPNVEGVWRFDADEIKYISERPGVSLIEFDLLELTEDTLVIGYVSGDNYIILHQVKA